VERFAVRSAKSPCGLRRRAGVLGAAERVAAIGLAGQHSRWILLVPVSMMLPANVNRLTMAAQSRGSVKVLVQPLKLSLLAIATELVSSFSVNT
jgi:hypothetical protein